MRVLIVGMGKSGAAAARLALREGHEVTAYDRLPPERLSEDALCLVSGRVAFRHGDEDPALLRGQDLLVLSPGVPGTSPLVAGAPAFGVEVLGELEWAGRHARGRIALVTGSNGKSTTTSLLGALLSASLPDVRVGGNLGVPLSDLVEGSTEQTWHVVEASSFQLESTRSLRADVAVLLNITPDHQDRYAGIEAYRRAKARVFLNQGPADHSVYSVDDPACAALGGELPARRVPFSAQRPLTSGAFLRAGRAWLAGGGGDPAPLFEVSDVPLPGVHNLENALAAAAAAVCCGVPARDLPAPLRAFRGLPHRLEFLGEGEGVRVYNDSKATNADSVLKALTAFHGGVILLLGGRDKGADWESLLREVRRRCRLVVAFGEARATVERVFRGKVPVEAFPGLGEATRAALALAEPGNTVLLSPACASFDEFRNFEERGDRFREWVRLWMEGAP